jgi:hypothetical protein
MSDLVVTVPKTIWFEWIAEGDGVGEPASGEEWAYWVSAARPPIEPGDRLYVVAWGMLRGYAPVTRVAMGDHGRYGICRRGEAVACTVKGGRWDGFRGYRKRWWMREQEVPFPTWKTENIPGRQVALAIERGALSPSELRSEVP